VQGPHHRDVPRIPPRPQGQAGRVRAAEVNLPSPPAPILLVFSRRRPHNSPARPPGPTSRARARRTPWKGGAAMRFALLTALLPALAGVGNEAEKLLQEVEKKIASAKSLRVVSDFVVQERGKDLRFEGSLDLAGDKMRMRLSGNVEGKEMKMELVSD